MSHDEGTWVVKGTGRTILDTYGGTPAIGIEGILQKWIEDTQNKWLLTFAQKAAKKGETAIHVLEQILSLFHRDTDNNPVLGNWMLKRCLINSGLAIFNATKDKTHPSQQRIPYLVKNIEPFHIHLHNGSLITQPTGIRTYTISKPEGKKTKSFFKAYEYIKAGATFEVTMEFDKTMLTRECLDKLLAKAQDTGLGSFRERFGKFEWIKLEVQ